MSIITSHPQSAAPKVSHPGNTSQTHGPGHTPPHGRGTAKHKGRAAVVRPLWQRGWVWGIAVLLVGLGVGAYLTKQTGEDVLDGKGDVIALIGQMRAGSEGWVQGNNVFGGELRSLGEGSRHGVIATKIPNKVCVEAGLALAKDGLITVNGIMPPRVSAGKLATLCNDAENTSTLQWMPH